MNIIFFLVLLCTGAYYEYQSYILCIGLILMLYSRARKEGVLIWRDNYLVVAFLFISLLYILSSIWAIDSHMAFYGGLKFLAIALCIIVYIQNPTEKENMVKNMPIIGTAITLISFAASLFPILRTYLWTAGRLAGTMQYPNTYGLFLFVCLLCLVNTEKMSHKSVAEAAVLVTGILLTGSRTVFLLMPMALLGNGIVAKDKKRKVCCYAIVGISMIVVLIGIYFRGNTAIARLAEISLSQSTLLGRLLYWKDALPVILKNPLGLGYMGYYFTQGGFQTGVYSVTHVHNEFLQMFLDIGWIGGLAFTSVWIYGFIKARAGWHRIVLTIMAIHAFVDFDLQFIAMYIVFMAFLPMDQGEEKKLCFKDIKRYACKGYFCLTLILSYYALGNAAYYSNIKEISEWCYPKNTLQQIKELTQAEDVESIRNISEEIVKNNMSVSLAWSGMARAAFADGDIERMIDNKRKAISLARYSVEEYEDYIKMLLTAAQLYRSEGEIGSAEYCIKEVLNVQRWMEEVKAQTDPLAWKLTDKPELALSDGYQLYVDIIKNRLSDS